MKTDSATSEAKRPKEPKEPKRTRQRRTKSWGREEFADGDVSEFDLVEGVIGLLGDPIGMLIRQRRKEDRELELKEQRQREAWQETRRERARYRAETRRIIRAARQYDRTGVVDDCLRPSVEGEIKRRERIYKARKAKEWKAMSRRAALREVVAELGYRLSSARIVDGEESVVLKIQYPDVEPPGPKFEPEVWRARAAKALDYYFFQCASSPNVNFRRRRLEYRPTAAPERCADAQHKRLDVDLTERRSPAEPSGP